MLMALSTPCTVLTRFPDTTLSWFGCFTGLASLPVGLSLSSCHHFVLSPSLLPCLSIPSTHNNSPMSTSSSDCSPKLHVCISKSLLEIVTWMSRKYQTCHVQTSLTSAPSTASPSPSPFQRLATLSSFLDEKSLTLLFLTPHINAPENPVKLCSESDHIPAALGSRQPRGCLGHCTAFHLVSCLDSRLF